MKLAAIARSLQADMQAELRDLERATAVGTKEAGRGLRTELRRQVSSAGLGQRLANSWRDQHYPNQKLDAASLVYTKAPQIIRAFDEGAVKVPAFFRHAGVKLNSIALEFTRSGPAAATINAIAQGETRFGTSQGGTPTSLTFSRISQFQGSITRAGSPVGNLTGGSVTYSNNLEKIETIRDDGLIEGADPTIAALTGRIEVRFADATLIDLAAAGMPVDLEFAYTLSAQAKLVLTAHEVYLPKPKLAVEGPGGVQASFDFRGAKNTAAGRMLTVTLTNDLDGLVYG